MKYQKDNISEDVLRFTTFRTFVHIQYVDENTFEVKSLSSVKKTTAATGRREHLRLT